MAWNFTTSTKSIMIQCKQMLFIVILTSSVFVIKWHIILKLVQCFSLHNIIIRVRKNLKWLVSWFFSSQDLFYQISFSRLTIWRVFFFFSLTQLLEDVQKVLSVKIDEDSTETLEIISEDFKTLRKIWNKVRQRPAQETLSGKNFFSFFWSFPEIFWNYLDFCSWKKCRLALF